MTSKTLPRGFLLGAATSAYQIEGSWNEGGKGESIWDRFAHTPGTIQDGSTGDIACDHAHRLAEDLDLMSDLGLDAYRFSISWPRVLPAGVGTVSGSGLAFYDRLVDGLLERGIRPFATLYHWDLPQAIQEHGGWAVRDTVDAFCEYAYAVARRLGDRVKDWITLNEPSVSALVGHSEGRHAPGHRDPSEALAVTHHLLLAHGRSAPILRSASNGALVGISLALYPIRAASPSPHDRLAADRLDGLLNRTYLDPLVGRGYPAEVPYDSSTLAAHIHEGDLAGISTPIDFLGVNYYTRHIVRSNAIPESENEPRQVHPAAAVTEMGWEIYPEGLFEILDRLDTEYAFDAYYITENGAATVDRIDHDGRVHDPERISYLRSHVEAALRALDAGIPLHGYFAWSLLDNFEWSHGFSKRFGLVYVDFETRRRTPKSSFTWYRRLIASRTIPG